KEAFPVKRLPAGITALAVLPDGQTVHAGQADGIGVYCWIDKPGLRVPGGGRPSTVEALVPSPDGHCVCRIGTGGYGPLLLVPTPATKAQRAFPVGLDGNSAAFSSDGKTLAIGADSGTIHVFQVEEDKPKEIKQIPN